MGNARMLPHKFWGKVLFLMQQEITKKLVCDFKVEVDSEYFLKCVENQNAWLWLALDRSEGEPLVRELALRLASTVGTAVDPES